MTSEEIYPSPEIEFILPKVSKRLDIILLALYPPIFVVAMIFSFILMIPMTFFGILLQLPIKMTSSIFMSIVVIFSIIATGYTGFQIHIIVKTLQNKYFLPLQYGILIFGMLTAIVFLFKLLVDVNWLLDNEILGIPNIYTLLGLTLYFAYGSYFLYFNENVAKKRYIVNR